MTYKEAREFIDHSNQYGSKLGLETITELLRRLGNPQDKLKVIHVAGTNGKGSTTAFLATILASSGYRIGRYISPAVFCYQERIQISEKVQNEIMTEYITEEGICATISQIKTACEGMLKDHYSHPTSFEIETAMALLYLLWQQVDFAVIEVGLGGRLDATNVFQQPECCVITSISMDHMQYLGDTLSKIAAEKAGIIKLGAPVITSNDHPNIREVLEAVCREKETSLTLADRNEITKIQYTSEKTIFTYRNMEYEITLLGEYQVINAILAIRTIETLRLLGHIVSDTAIKEGLCYTKWSGRFEILKKDPYFIIDGAHNEEAALQLKNTLEQYFYGRKLIFIMGVLEDKDFKGILRIMAPLASTIITITPDNNRALASTQLAIEAKKYCYGSIIDADTVDKAVAIAYLEAKKEDVIIAFGSLSYLSNVKEALFCR